MVVFWSPLTTFSPGRRVRPSATSGLSPGTYQTIEQHGALYCPNIPRKNDWTNPAHSPSTECLAWTFREEPSPECRLLDSEEKACTSSYSPSLVDPQDCGQGGETTTTPAMETTSQSGQTGRLVLEQTWILICIVICFGRVSVIQVNFTVLPGKLKSPYKSMR